MPRLDINSMFHFHISFSNHIYWLAVAGREKTFLFGGAVDARRTDSFSGSFDDDGMSTDDGVQSLRSTPTHPSCSDRITIEDFYILKPISRGAFGRVFLAKKRSTGDLFAIKVS